MMKRLALLASAVCLCTAAAANPVRVDASSSFNPAGVESAHAVPKAALAAPHSPRLATGTVIYSNFNSDASVLYDCCNGYTVRGAAIGLGYQRMAMPFTPATDTHLHEVIVAISTSGGFDSIIGTLQEDDNGLPGNVIGQVIIHNLTALGDCCDTETLRGGLTPLQAGKTYWIVATPKDVTAAEWNYTTTGNTGPGAFDTGSGWQTFDDVQSAFEVIGD